MGFLKFLKREKKEDLQDLDLPPAPPPLEESQQDFNADFSFNEKSQDIPDFPDIPDIKVSDESKFDLPQLDFEQEKEEPELPDLEEPAPIPPIRFPTTMPEPMPIPAQPPMQMPQPEAAKKEPIQAIKPRKLFSHERKHIERKEVYLRVDKFRAALESISMIRGSLRQSEELLMKLENIKNAKDRSFDKVKSSLDDMQKKLIFVDKTLFKGE